MSGGSFNYVSVRDLETPTEEHDLIAEAVAEHSEEIATALREVLRRLRAAMQEAESEWAKYKGVLRAVEWERSGDGGVEAIKREIEKVSTP